MNPYKITAHVKGAEITIENSGSHPSKHVIYAKFNDGLYARGEQIRELLEEALKPPVYSDEYRNLGEMFEILQKENEALKVERFNQLLEISNMQDCIQSQAKRIKELEAESHPTPTPERKVVQVLNTEETCVALCNDGTMWYLYSNQWNPLPPIPQPEGGEG